MNVHTALYNLHSRSGGGDNRGMLGKKAAQQGETMNDRLEELRKNGASIPGFWELIEICDEQHSALESARAEIARLREELSRHEERRFPIQGGPSVPWSAISPHESQCRKNHDQSLQRLAERGGLEPEEAYLVVNGRSYHDLMMASNEQIKEFREGWWSFAEKANSKQAEANWDRWEARAEELTDENNQLKNEIRGLIGETDADGRG